MERLNVALFLGIAALTITIVPTAPKMASAADIFACKNNKSGASKIVTPGTRCKTNETLVHWPSEDTDTLGDLSCSAGQTVTFNGSAWVCDPPRFVDNGDGTISDNQTGLMWEKKTGSFGSGIVCSTTTSCPDPHNVNNQYQWSFAGIGDTTNPTGTLFSDFLPRINTALSTSADGITVAEVCFAGHCDWRVPNIAELRTMVLAPYPSCGTSPCIDPIFEPTVSAFHWSSTTNQGLPTRAWGVNFDNGYAGYSGKVNVFFVRAVRGGR